MKNYFYGNRLLSARNGTARAGRPKFAAAAESIGNCSETLYFDGEYKQLMGEAELLATEKKIVISSHLITYGTATSVDLTEQIRREIEESWNEPAGALLYRNERYRVAFHITAEQRKDISEMEVLQNTDPRNNYFRIEEFAHGNISFVDGLGCNTGYFLLQNLYAGSTTAAHEYGHTLGLDHPRDLDLRGRGVPGIMYPRGTLVDPPYQYDPSAVAGQPGGTLHPMHRRVKQADIDQINLQKLLFQNGRAVVGAFTNVFHWDHRLGSAEDFSMPVVMG